MQLPLQITVRNLTLPERAQETIREKAEGLNKFYDRITRCRVIVEMPQRHHRKGLSYDVRLDLTVPGLELAVRREPNEDLFVAIRDAFDAARRQLEDFAGRQQAILNGKRHAPEI